MGKLYALSQVGELVKILQRIDPGCWRRGSRQNGSRRTRSRRISTSAKQTLTRPRAPNKLSLATKALSVSRLAKLCRVFLFFYNFYVLLLDPWIKNSRSKTLKYLSSELAVGPDGNIWHGPSMLSVLRPFRHYREPNIFLSDALIQSCYWRDSTLTWIFKSFM